MISLKTTTKNDINGSDPSVQGLQFEGMTGALVYVGALVVSPIWEASLAWESGIPGSEAEQLPLLGKAQCQVWRWCSSTQAQFLEFFGKEE